VHLLGTIKRVGVRKSHVLQIDSSAWYSRARLTSHEPRRTADIVCCIIAGLSPLVTKHRHLGLGRQVPGGGSGLPGRHGGHHRDQGLWVYSEEIAHPPIVDGDTFARAQRLLAAKNARTVIRRPRTSPRAYVLRGVLFCGICTG
jgi:hypothetical protein